MDEADACILRVFPANAAESRSAERLLARGLFARTGGDLIHIHREILKNQPDQ